MKDLPNDYRSTVRIPHVSLEKLKWKVVSWCGASAGEYLCTCLAESFCYAKTNTTRPAGYQYDFIFYSKH